MAYNLKAGIVATTTMVGSALAYTKSQSLEERVQGLSSTGKNGQRQAPGQAEEGNSGCSKYQDTVNQMMHWKY